MDKNLTKNILLKQHNAITEARYEMTALEKNIVYMIMAQFIRDDDPSKKQYFISIQELKNKLKELGEKISLEDIQEATDKLITRVYSFYDDFGNSGSMALFASVTYTDGCDLIKIEILSTVRHFMFDLKYDFTSFSLWSALRLRSIYAKRIYEMLCQHKDVGIFKISVQELRERLKLSSKLSKKDKLSGWSAFEKTVLEGPQKEINEKTELKVTYTLEKTGLKYTEIKFHISKKDSEETSKSTHNQLELAL
jgi:plasmid replication initiation protein